MKRILVTGGAGFIGSNFIKYFLKAHPKYSIVNLDKLTYCGNLENLKEIENNSRYRFVKGDICDAKLIRKVLKGSEAIIHFAAESHVDRSIVGPSEFIRTNIYGTYLLLEAAKEYKISQFLQISTDEVYGSRPRGFFKETDVLKPSSPYSASKAAADQLVYSYHVTYNLPIKIIRPTNNFGPYQFPEKAIPLFITNALKGKKVPVYGDGLNVRDWLYVLDNCRAIDFILHKGKIGEIYNVAGNSQMKNIDLTRLILKTMKKRADLIKFVQDRPGHDRRYALDSSKIAKLGWRPGHNFREALRETIDWYCDNQQWWQPLIGR
ncbi:MAG: dTDP-glucose 4,6-dehydratase [Candidatus Omnitrophica bacterium]|nr:dTDP-glucose 4,6-dehydratase [Candidatus Omnitrophota bacterium]